MEAPYSSLAGAFAKKEGTLKQQAARSFASVALPLKVAKRAAHGNILPNPPTLSSYSQTEVKRKTPYVGTENTREQAHQ